MAAGGRELNPGQAGGSSKEDHARRPVAMIRTRFLTLLALLAFGLAAQAETLVGCPIRIDTAVDGNLRSAGCEVTLDAPVSGNARLAGGSVEIGNSAAVAGDLSIAGGNVVVKGTVKGSLHAAGGHVLIDGTIGDDASVGAGSLELGPNARIGGKLTFRGADLARDPAAQVTGGVVQKTRHMYRDDFGPFGHHHGFFSWIWVGGLMLLAGVFAGLLPGYSGRMADELKSQPWMPPLLGFIALVCIPAAAVLLMVTIIGIPIGVLAILGYVALLLIGYVCTSVVTGNLVLDRVNAQAAPRTAWRMGAAAAAMLVIALIGHIPFIGGFVAFAALVVGVGLIVATIVHRKPDETAGTAA
jgi:cytoskeletal protein CcmA (bactofilin family)